MTQAALSGPFCPSRYQALRENAICLIIFIINTNQSDTDTVRASAVAFHPYIPMAKPKNLTVAFHYIGNRLHLRTICHHHMLAYAYATSPFLPPFDPVIPSA